MSAPATAHVYRAAPDNKYPSLVNPACSCGGLRYSGFVRAWFARLLFDKHVAGAA